MHGCCRISKPELKVWQKERRLKEELKEEEEAEGSNQANINAAQRMLADGMPKELVMKYTGLSLDQISNIN